jgi:hypothetical protein
MTVVNFSGLCKHATDHGYRLAALNPQILPVARAFIDIAVSRDAPIVLTTTGPALQDGLLPSLEAMARQASIPVALLGTEIRNRDQAVLAIRSGCNGMVFTDGISESAVIAMRGIAESCGIPVIHKDELSGVLRESGEQLESATLQAVAEAPRTWRRFNELVAQAAGNFVLEYLEELGAAGQGRAALEATEAWRPVEHLIIYNSTADDATSAEIAAEGRRVLDKIPGVRATWTGRSVRLDAKYRWCWLVRFAHPAVIDAYREHPDHVSYADHRFRPIADDRISIDYELTGAEEVEWPRRQ